MDVDMRTRSVARAAMLTALGCALLYVSALVPTGRLALIAVAGLVTAFSLLTLGPKWSLCVYLAVTALSLIILPLKAPAVLFAVFFGYYPLAKSFFERRKSRAFCYILKFLLINAVFLLIYFLAGEIISEAFDFSSWMFPVALLAVNAAFFLYDLCISKLVFMYLKRTEKHI